MFPSQAQVPQDPMDFSLAITTIMQEQNLRSEFPYEVNGSSVLFENYSYDMHQKLLWIIKRAIEDFKRIFKKNYDLKVIFEN